MLITSVELLVESLIIYSVFIDFPHNYIAPNAIIKENFLTFYYSRQIDMERPMNIAFFMQPKALVAYIYNDFSLRQVLEKMNHYHYSAVPVIDREGRYKGTVSEGDLLWYIVQGEGGEPHTRKIEELEDIYLDSLNLSSEKNSPVSITASIDELLSQAMNQNFIPIVDDRGLFIGIVTRKKVMEYFYTNVTPAKAIEDDTAKIVD